jgi:hypothetical protein
MADGGDYILRKGITCGDPQEVNLQNITESFGLLFISPPPLMKASFQRVVGEINNPADGGVSDTLRREGDSNPRYGYPYGSLANCWFKPLTHRSKKRFINTTCLVWCFSNTTSHSGTKIKNHRILYKYIASIKFRLVIHTIY